MTRSDVSDAPQALHRRRFFALAGGAVITAFLPGRDAQAMEHASSALAFNGQSVILAGRDLRSVDVFTGQTVDLTAPAQPVHGLVNHPDHPQRLLAALKGGGIMSSNDGGRSWYSAGSGLPKAQITALTVAAAAPDTIYAAIAGDGLWRSEDAGESWSFVMDRPWIEKAEREVLTLTSVNLASGMGGIWLYAGTEKGVTRVPDCFCRWQDVVAGDAMDALVAGDTPPPEAPLPGGEPVLALISAPAAPERLYAALPSGLWASIDGGVIWEQKSKLRARALIVDPADPDHILATTDTELQQSRDGGAKWVTLAAL